MGNLSELQRQNIVGVRLAVVSVTKTATLLCVSRAAVSTVMMVSSAEGNGGQKPELSERDRCTMKRIVI